MANRIEVMKMTTETTGIEDVWTDEEGNVWYCGEIVAWVVDWMSNQIAKDYVDLVSWLVENHIEVIQEYNKQKVVSEWVLAVLFGLVAYDATIHEQSNGAILEGSGIVGIAAWYSTHRLRLRFVMKVVSEWVGWLNLKSERLLSMLAPFRPPMRNSILTTRTSLHDTIRQR